MSGSVLHLLADGRLPVGGHAHSGGLEAALACGLIGADAGPDSLASFLVGRLHTSGLVAAGLAARSCSLVIQGACEAEWTQLDHEATARMVCAAARAASRAQGRGLLRLVRATWSTPVEALLGDAPHCAVAQGAVVALISGNALDAAQIAAYSSVSGPAWAAVRLLSLDPVSVSAMLVALCSDVDEVAAEAARRVSEGELPSTSAPLLDLLSSAHSQSEVRFFAS